MSEQASPWIVHVTEADFQQVVVDGSYEHPVVVDFWAPWCDPCRDLARELEPLIEERRGAVVLAKVNVDDCPNLAAYFRIEGIPAVKAFRDGALVLQFEGVLPRQHLQAFLDRIAPGATDEAKAREEEKRDPADAEKHYRAALEKDGNDMQARVGLARALLAQNKTKEIAEILEPIGSSGDVGVEADRIKAELGLRELARDLGTETEARRRLAVSPTSSTARYELGCVLAAAGKYEEALELLLSAAEEDYKLAPTKIRDAMVKIFYALGSSHPLADEYRSRLTRLLY
jgi:putative thioredoxin